MHNRFRKYSPVYFIKKAGATLVKTITSLLSYAILLLNNSGLETCIRPPNPPRPAVGQVTFTETMTDLAALLTKLTIGKFKTDLNHKLKLVYIAC